MNYEGLKKARKTYRSFLNESYYPNDKLYYIGVIFAIDDLLCETHSTKEREMITSKKLPFVFIAGYVDFLYLVLEKETKNLAHNNTIDVYLKKLERREK